MQDLLLLKGKFFVFVDFYLYIGYLVLCYQLQQVGEDVCIFFVKIFFIGGYKKVVQVVVSGFVDVGLVDSFVWDMLVIVEFGLIVSICIVVQFGEYGFLLLVVGCKVKVVEFNVMCVVLFGMVVNL